MSAVATSPDVVPGPAPAAAPAVDAIRRLHCMEIWGGSEAADSRVSVPGVDAHVVCRPHRGDAAGGDIHYVSNCMAGTISRFVLADVSGHGASASELALSLRRLMRKHINTPDQARFARALNEEFSGLTDEGRFATAVLATYFAPTDHLIVCNAGHPRALWWRAYDEQWELLDSSSTGASSEPSASDLGISNLPLGILDPTIYEQFAVWLARGDAVIFYSDALIESADSAGRPLGEGGLLDIARTLDPGDPAGLAERLLDAVELRHGGRLSDDDVTVLVLHHNGADPPSLPIAERIKILGRVLGLVP